MGNKPTVYFPIAGEDYSRCRVLGRGSFGKVYAMEHATTDTFRVVKEMHKATIVAKGTSFVELLINERNLLSLLKGCPFVVKCFAACQDEKYLYMLLEFCSGGELDYHLKARGKFTEDFIKNYVAQITLGLEYMHRKYHVVHRDLKPENVLLDSRGYCAIIDFNMAFHCGEDMQVPNPEHFIIGTLPYIAPELLLGRDHSDKVDWWSLGIMTYEFFHGKQPFKACEGPESEKKRMLKSIQSITLSDIISTSCSNNLANLITGLLEIETDRRFGAEEIKSHPFFESFDWDALLNRTIDPPILPDENNVNFKPDANVEELFGLDKPKETNDISEEQQALFTEWDWVAEDQELPLPIPEKLQKANKTKKKTKRQHSTTAFAEKKTKSQPEIMQTIKQQ